MSNFSKSDSVANITSILSKFSIGGRMQQGELEKCLEDLKGIGATMEESDRLVGQLKEENAELHESQHVQQERLVEHEKRVQELTQLAHHLQAASSQHSAPRQQTDQKGKLAEEEEYDENDDENEEDEAQEVKVLDARRSSEYANTRVSGAAAATGTGRTGFDFSEKPVVRTHHKMTDYQAYRNYDNPEREEQAPESKDVGFRPRSNEPRQFSMNSSQPLYKGKFNEDLDEWLWTTETNLSAAGIEAGRQVIVAAGYLRENAQQAYRQICTRFKNLNWETFQKEMRARFEYSESTEVLVGKLCALKQESGVEDYIEKFTYIANRGNLDDAVAVGLFVKGLVPELAGETRYKKPKTLNAAIHVVLDFVQVKLGQKIGQPAASANFVGTGSKKDACFKCGTPGHFARDCRKKVNEWQRNDRPKYGNKSGGYRQSFKSGGSSDETLKEISKMLSQLTEKCNGGLSCKDDKKKAYNNSRGPPQRSERSETSHKREQQKEDREADPSERPVKKAKRRFNDRMQTGDENEAGSNTQAGASYIYSIGQSEKGYETKPLFRVTAMFNGVETEAFLDTGASITIITKELADAMDVEIDKTKCGSVKLADNSKAKTEGITEMFQIEVEKSTTRIRALVLSATSSPILLGMDWFWATGAIVCPKQGTLHFLEENGHVARMLDCQAPIKRLADAKFLDILRDIGLGTETEDGVQVFMVDSDLSDEDQQSSSDEQTNSREQSDSEEQQSSSDEEEATHQASENTSKAIEVNKLSPHVYELFMLNNNKNSLNTEHDSDVDSVENFNEETTWPIMNEEGKRFYETFNEQMLTKEQNEKMRRILKRYDHCFAYSIKDLKSPCKLMPMKIELTTDKPIFTPPFRHTEKEHELIEAEVKTMLSAGVIKPSTSQFNSPILFVPKPGNMLRFCLDVRNINKKTVPSTHVLIPRQDEIFRKLNEALYFGLGDLKSGYWQQLVDKSCAHMTAFQTREGKFEYTRIPFGLKNAPFEFNRLMKHVFQDLKFVEVYFDDFIIASASINEQIKHVEIVLERLEMFNLKINPKKLIIFKTSIKILGHVISHKSIAMDKEKVTKIENWPRPRNNDELRSFVGLCGYYRKFIQEFAHTVLEFGNLQSKEKFVWSQNKDIAFRVLRVKFGKAPLLRQPDWKLEFQIHTDASGKAIGAVLNQKDNLGYEYVVEFASKALKGAELNYGVTEKECLAVKWAISHFRVFVHGRKFIVKTDHKALKWLMEIKEPSGRLARWILFLQSFDFVIEYREGKKHTNADALSRYSFMAQAQVTQTEVTKIWFIEPYQDEVLMEYLRDKQLPDGASTKQCNRLRKASEQLTLVDGYVWIKREIDEVEQAFKIPKINERAKIVMDAHKLGHFGTRETYLRIKEQFFWKKMYEFIDNIVKRCDSCLRFNKARDFAHPAMALPVKSVFDRVTMDLVFGFPVTKEGFKGMIVIVIYTTKYPWAVPIKSKTADEIAWHFLNFISMFGAPKQILSDQGKEFVNSVIERITSGFGIEHRITSAYKPDTNGITECLNKTLTGALRKHAEENPTEWNLWVPFVLMAYRSRVHPSTGFTPHELMFGAKMNVFKTDMQDEERAASESEIFNRSKEIQKLTEKTIPKAIQNIEAAQEQQKKTQNANRNVRFEELLPGQRVFIKSKKIQNKFEIKNHGPYTVIGKSKNSNYYLRNSEGKQLAVAYPLGRLKLMEPVADATIEAILNHRKRDGIVEYQVKYNNDVFPQEWIPVTEFKSTVLIEHYHTNIGKEKEGTQTARSAFKANHLFLAFVWFMLLLSTCGVKINDNFMLCISNENSQLIDTSGVCKVNETTTQMKKADYTVLERRKYIVSGMGTYCKRSKVLVRTWSEMFGQQHSERSVFQEVVTAAECRALKLSRNCFGSVMTCSEQNKCVFEQEPELKRSYWVPMDNTIYNCEFGEHLVMGATLDRPLFSDATSSCRAQDLSCILAHSTVIWDANVIHKCPYYRVQALNATVSDNLVVGDNFMFQTTKSFRDCEMDITETTEGVFLTTSKRAESLEQSNVEIKENFNLLLADVDFKSLGLLKILNRITQRASENMCNLIKTELRLFQKHIDEYLAIHDMYGNQIVVYNNFGEIRLTNCEPFEKIYIIERTNGCYRDIPVLVEKDDTNITAFLTHNGVLRKHSRTVDCSEKQIMSTPNSHWRIVKVGNQTKAFNASQIFAAIKFMANNQIMVNWTHDIRYLEKFDIWHTLSEITKSSDDENVFMTHQVEKPRQESLNEAGQFVLESMFEKTKQWIKFGAIVCASLAVLYICFKLRKCIVLGCKFCCKNYTCIRRNPQQANNETVDMRPIRHIYTRRQGMDELVHEPEAEVLNDSHSIRLVR